MDEAELLGDRVCIMSAGRVKALGSSMFLKRSFQCGYDLTFVKESETSEANAAILAAVNSKIPQTTVMSSIGSELVIQVPFSSASAFKPLFTDIQAKSKALGVKTFGITSTKLEDVFLKVASAGLQHDESDGPVELLGATEQRSQGLSLASHQFGGQVAKRFNQATRDGRVFVCNFVLPLLMITAGLGLSLVRVTVAPAQAKVEYFLAARSTDANRKNLSLAHSYVVKPKG
jgi:hypothetical protein